MPTVRNAAWKKTDAYSRTERDREVIRVYGRSAGPICRKMKRDSAVVRRSGHARVEGVHLAAEDIRGGEQRCGSGEFRVGVDADGGVGYTGTENCTSVRFGRYGRGFGICCGGKVLFLFARIHDLHDQVMIYLEPWLTKVVQPLTALMKIVTDRPSYS